MKILLSLVIVVSSISTFSITQAEVQDRAQAREQARAQVRMPAQIRARSRAVTIIKPADVHLTAAQSLKIPEPPKPNTPGQFKARASKPSPKPPGSMGNIQQTPKGKLKVTLTPKRPARNNVAYMTYQYPQSVSLSNDNNHVVFSKGNIPGSMRYTVRLDKDKKYLVEIMADPWGTSGGKVQHDIGDSVSIHEFGKFNEQINISRVIQASENGWVSGSLRQANPAANQWRIYSVNITEMD